jgi:hypothetical protein
LFHIVSLLVTPSEKGSNFSGSLKQRSMRKIFQIPRDYSNSVSYACIWVALRINATAQAG